MIAFRVFGGVSLLGEGGFLSGKPAQPRRMALLALLATHPHATLSREKLLAFLWPDSDEGSGRHGLSESLYVLRKALGEEILVSEGDQIRLDLNRIDCDVVAFRRALEDGDLEAGAELYTGPFLDGFFLNGAGEFQRWVESERKSLAEDYGRVVEALANAAARDGDHLESVRWWNRLTALDPYNSRYALGLMRTLAGAGDPGNAIQYALKHLHRLKEDLGADPPPEILSLTEDLRNGGIGFSDLGRKDPAAPGLDPEWAHESKRKDTLEPSPSARGRSQGRPGAGRMLRTVGAGLVLVILAAWTTYASLLRSRPPSFQGDLVAVHPFENWTGDPELDDTAILAAFRVEEALQGVEGVHVVPSSLILPLGLLGTGDGPGDQRRAGPESANPAWEVRGTIREEGDSLEIRAEVVDLRESRREQQVVELGPRGSGSTVLDRLARRVAGAMAVAFEPLLREAVGAYQPLPSPPLLEAALEHRQGYRAADQGDFGAAYHHHVTAYAMDTTLVRAVVAAAYMTRNYSLKDSLARFARERTHLLTAKERLDLDLLEAMLAHDHARALRAIRAAASLEDGGYASVAEAFFAIRVNLPEAALKATEDYDPDLEWRRPDTHAFWRYRALALHMLERYGEELEEAREGRERFATRSDLLIAEVRALAALGRVEEVEKLLHQAQALPGTGGSAALLAGEELRAHGYPLESKKAFEMALTWLKVGSRENLPESEVGLPLARALYGAGRWAEAKAVSLRILEESPEDVSAQGMLGLTAARMGDTVAATAVLRRLEGMSRRETPGEHLYLMASISAVLGRPDEAMRHLLQAYDDGLPHRLSLHRDMNLESLKDREDFQALLEPKG